MINVIISNVIGNGAKYVATNLSFANNVLEKESSTLLIDFDLQNPTLGKVFYDNSEKKSFNIIINELNKNKSINKDFIKENIYSTGKGVDILIGRDINDIDYYNNVSKEKYSELLSILNNLYENIYVVINKEPDNLITLSTLINCNNVIIVGRNNISNEMALDNTINIVRAYTNEANIYYITNMYEGGKLDLSKNLKKKNLRFLGNLKYQYSSIDNKNLKGVFYSKLNSNNKVFLKTIKRIKEDNNE